MCWVDWPFLHVEHGHAWVGSIAAQQHECILTLCLRMWPWTDLRRSHPQLNSLHTLEDFDAYWADRKRSSAETVQAARTRLRNNPARCARFIALHSHQIHTLPRARLCQIEGGRPNLVTQQQTTSSYPAYPIFKCPSGDQKPHPEKGSWCCAYHNAHNPSHFGLWNDCHVLHQAFACDRW